MDNTEQIIKSLPPELQKEVEDFARFLFERSRRKSKILKQDWAGGLEEFKDKYTSLKLQKKALEWRGD